MEYMALATGIRVVLLPGMTGSAIMEYSESQDSVKEYLLSLVRKDIEKSKKKEKKKKTSNK